MLHCLSMSYIFWIDLEAYEFRYKPTCKCFSEVIQSFGCKSNIFFMQLRVRFLGVIENWSVSKNSCFLPTFLSVLVYLSYMVKFDLVHDLMEILKYQIVLAIIWRLWWFFPTSATFFLSFLFYSILSFCGLYISWFCCLGIYVAILHINIAT